MDRLTDEQIDYVLHWFRRGSSHTTSYEMEALCAQAKLANRPGVLVPVELTDEMLKAARDIYRSDEDATTADIYRAMLSACLASSEAKGNDNGNV